MSNKYIVITINYIGKFKIKKSVLGSQRYFKTAISRLLKSYNYTIYEYINKYIQKLELCGFCDKHISTRYDFALNIDATNTLQVTNIKCNDGFMCSDPKCKTQRGHINPNSFEFIQKKFKISYEEAIKLQKQINKSSFYKKDDETYEEYANRQRRDKNYFINKYGEQEGLIRYQKFANGKNRTKKALAEKYGIKYANAVSEKKKPILSNFIKRHGEEVGKQKYIEWISKCTKIGFYLNNQTKKIPSKAAYTFFKKLSDKIILENICKKDDIIFADGLQSEYRFMFFNEQNMLHWYYLDFLIKSYKINVEFNGTWWHNEYNNKKTQDEVRYNRLQANGYKVIIVWDYECCKSRIDETVNNTINEIKDYINEKIK